MSPIDDIKDRVEDLEGDVADEGDEGTPAAKSTGDDLDELDDEEIEKRARRQGWTPEEEWNEERAARNGLRKPSRFLTAREFLENIGTRMPMLKERNKALHGRIDELEGVVKEMKGFVEDQRRMGKEAVIRAREDERKKVLEEMRNAAAEGDMDAHDKATAKLNAIDEQTRKELEKPQGDKTEADLPAETQRWLGENPWFLKVPHLHEAMKAAHIRVKKASPAMGEYESLQKAMQDVMRRFPEDFGQDGAAGNRRMPPATNTGDLRRGDPGKAADVERRFSQIPKADQEAYEKHRKMFEKIGQKFTKAEFMADYEGA